MIPRLALRGKYVLATSLLFLVVGTLHGAPPLVALSAAILSVLLALYLMFYPTAILLRRKKIELSWWVPPGEEAGGALSVDRPFQLHLAFRNHGSRKLRILSSNILAATGLAIDDRPSATVRSGMQVEVTTTVRALAAGYHVLHGAALTFGDALGLFDIEAFFPNPIAIKVFPRAIALRGQPVRAVAFHAMNLNGSPWLCSRSSRSSPESPRRRTWCWPTVSCSAPAIARTGWPRSAVARGNTLTAIGFGKNASMSNRPSASPNVSAAPCSTW